MLESYLEKKLVKRLEKLGGLCWKFSSPGTTGVPDRIIVLPNGRIIFAELKSETGRLSKIQEYRLKQLTDRGAESIVIRGARGLRDFLERVENEI